MPTRPHCPYCGAPVSPEARYCDHCGVPLTKDAARTAPQPRRLPRRVAVWVFVLVLAIFLGVGTAGGFRYKAGFWPLGSAVQVFGLTDETQGVSVPRPGTDDAAVAEHLRSVVAISVQSTQGDKAGSGFIADAAGRVVTAAHVVEGARCVTVMDSNGRLHQGTVAATKPAQDLALVLVPGLADWPGALELGASEGLEPYSVVYVMGFPKGLGNSLALTAQVSQLNDRKMIDNHYFSNLIQVSGAQVMEGTSGGPLIARESGRVVGVVTAGTEGALAYAIPAEEVTAALAEWSGVAMPSLCQPVPAARTTPVLLAAIAPLTGVDGIDGADLVDGVTLAVRDMEENLRAAGYEVLVQPYDDRSSPAVARALAETAAGTPNVVGVVGSLDSKVTQAVAETLLPNGLTLVAPTSGADELTTYGWPHFNRLVANTQRQPQAAARYAKNRLGLKGIFVLQDGSPEEARDVATFEWAAQILDLPLLGQAALTPGLNYPSLVNQIRESGADGLYLAAEGTTAIEAVQRLRREGIAMPILGGEALFDQRFQTLTGSEHRDIFFTRLTAEPSEPFQRHYESVMGKPTRGYAAYGYDAASVILAGLIRYGSEHPAEIPPRTELAELVRGTTGYSGRTSWISFDAETGENETSWVYMFEWQQGLPVLRENLQ